MHVYLVYLCQPFFGVIWICFRWHIGAVVSAVTLQQEGLRFKSYLFLKDLCVASPTVFLHAIVSIYCTKYELPYEITAAWVRGIGINSSHLYLQSILSQGNLQKPRARPPKSDSGKLKLRNYRKYRKKPWAEAGLYVGSSCWWPAG